MRKCVLCHMRTTSAQSDWRLCCSLPRQNGTSSLYIRNFKILVGLCSWAGQFESCPIGDSRRHIFSWPGLYRIHEMMYNPFLMALVIVIAVFVCYLVDNLKSVCLFYRYSLFLLHSAMQSVDQKKVFKPSPPGIRKIVSFINMHFSYFLINILYTL